MTKAELDAAIAVLKKVADYPFTESMLEQEFEDEIVDEFDNAAQIALIAMRDMRKKMDGCCYCDDDRIIDQGAVWLGKVGTIACINSNNELVVNIDGAQANIPILGCPWCCKKLDSNAEVCSE